MLNLWKWIKVSGSMSISEAFLLGFEEGKWKNFKGYGFSSPGPDYRPWKTIWTLKITNKLKFQTGCCRFHTRMHQASESCSGLSEVWVSIIPEDWGPLLFMPRHLQRHHKCISELHMNKKPPPPSWQFVCPPPLTLQNAAIIISMDGSDLHPIQILTGAKKKNSPQTEKHKQQEEEPLWRFWRQIKVSARFQSQQLLLYTQLPKEKILEILKKMQKWQHTRQIINLLSAVNSSQNMAEATGEVGEKTLAIKPWFMVSI